MDDKPFNPKTHIAKIMFNGEYREIKRDKDGDDYFYCDDHKIYMEDLDSTIYYHVIHVKKH